MENPSPECYTSVKPAFNLSTDNEIEERENLDDSEICEEPESKNLNDSDEHESHDNVFQNNDDELEDDPGEGENEEVAVSIAPSGQLVARPSQVADYQLRDEKLKHLCVWDFVSSIDKVPTSGKTLLVNLA